MYQPLGFLLPGQRGAIERLQPAKSRDVWNPSSEASRPWPDLAPDWPRIGRISPKMITMGEGLAW